MTEQPPRRITARTVALLVVASMVGIGVFTTSGFLLRDLGSARAVLLAWLAGGAGAVCGALAYAELGAALPENGGEYALLTRLYHPALGFLAGFISFVVGFGAPTAAVALAFGEYLDRVVPVNPRAAAVTMLFVLSAAQALHVKGSARLLEALTAVKVVLMLVFIAAAFAAPRPPAGPVEPALGATLATPGFALSVMFVSFSYGGWNAAAYIAGEIREPGRALPLGLLAGSAGVVALYLALNAVFLYWVPAAKLSGVLEVGHAAATVLFGERAARLVSGLIAFGLLSAALALLITGPRVSEAMGRDYPKLSILSRRSSEGGPALATLFQVGFSVLLIFTSSFEALLTYVGFLLSLCAALTVAGVFVLRARERGERSTYRAPGHPVTTLLALVVLLGAPIYALAEKPVLGLWGGLTLVAGLGLWFLVRPSPASAAPSR